MNAPRIIRTLTTVALMILIIGAAAPGFAAPGRRALLVGVSGYDRGGAEDMSDLNTGADVETIAVLLTRNFGFESDDILILDTPEETTHDAIVAAFRAWLIEPAAVDDIIYFHYSGHGTTVPDDDGDELDGFDESLVPSDYVSKRDGSRNIRDDEIAALLDELNARRPGNVTLTFDCCYSGTATRAGRMLVRGQACPEEALTDQATVRPGGAPDGGSGIAAASHPAAGGYVVLSATSQGQLAAEVENETGAAMGLFTYALVRAAGEAGPQTTYRDLYERVSDIMLRHNRRQTPQIEGELDRLLFAGVGRTPPAYTPVTGDPGGSLFLEAGALQGVTAGSRYALFAAGTSDFGAATPLTEAVVARVDHSYAELEAASGDVPFAALRAARAVEIEHNYRDNRLRVDLSALDGRPEWRELRAALSALPLVDASGGAAAHWDARLRLVEGDAVLLERTDGGEICAGRRGPDLAGRIEAALAGEARWRFIRDLENDDPYAQVGIELRVVPVEVRTDADGVVREVLGDLDLPRDDAGRLEMPAGTHVMLELRNTGYVDAYVTVLDLRGEGEIGPLWPYPGLRVQDNRILADGEWVRIPAPFIFRIDGPDGHEMFKAIATAEPADFSPLLDRAAIEQLPARRGGAPGVGDSPLGRLLRAATLGERSSASVAPGKWSTDAVDFRVTESR